MSYKGSGSKWDLAVMNKPVTSAPMLKLSRAEILGFSQQT